MNTYDRHTILKIHRSIHDPETSKVLLPREGVSLRIKKANNGCRMTTWKGFTFMEQNKAKNTVYAEKARNGAMITWGMSQKYPWLKIENDNIKNPQAWPYR